MSAQPGTRVRIIAHDEPLFVGRNGELHLSWDSALIVRDLRDDKGEAVGGYAYVKPDQVEVYAGDPAAALATALAEVERWRQVAAQAETRAVAAEQSLALERDRIRLMRRCTCGASDEQMVQS